MKLLPNFKLGPYEFVAEDEQPGVVILLILLFAFVLMAPRGGSDVSDVQETAVHAEE